MFHRIPASRQPNCLCEPLEPRMMLTTIQHVVPLGALVGRRYLVDQFLSKNTPSAHENVYQFSVSGSARVVVQLSRLNGFFGEDCDIF
ncbi:MAG: hypothetical protein ACREJC_13860, partial [Tepidisphaeraceae bacterium]